MTDGEKHVLVCDDDVITLRLIREALRSMACCHVETTTDPEYAFELVLKKQYDLLIFDLVMPKIEGTTLYSLILKVYEVLFPPEHRIPPLILITGNAAEAHAQGVTRMPGVRDVIPKPFKLDRLVAAIERALPS